MQLEAIKSNFVQALNEIDSTDKVEDLRVKYLGKNGIVTDQSKKIANLLPEERKSFGAAVNELRNFIEQNLVALRVKFENIEFEKKLLSENIDVSLPPRNFERGKIHPLNQTIDDIKQIFTSLGFEYAEGPDIEDDWHNFTALNIGEFHPARQLQDTFYLKNGKLLRTHTSNVQIRVMENGEPPFRSFSIGKTYRSDYDATHTPMFHQIEGIYLDKNVNMGHLKSCLETFLKLYFEVDQAPIRLRPSYFPFTEPSAEVDVKCDRSNKKQIKIGQGEGWLEILGCGMINPKVLKNCGIDPDEYQGFAFGAGIERLAMLKYNISDLRSFYESDIRWLKHYGF